MKKTELRQKVINGSFWTIVANISSQLITFSVTIVLARLLTPGDFGVVAISAVFTGIVTLFQDLGMGAAIIQKRDIDDKYLSTSFFVSIFAGIILALLLLALAPSVASFYKEPVLKPILFISAIGFILSPLTSIHTSILTKRLEFKKLAAINTATQALAGTFSVILALNGYGVWSLVLGKILSQPVLVPFVWIIVKWRPRIFFSKQCFLDLFGFSSSLLGFNMINFLSRNLDNLIIGKYLGSQALGYYSVAYNLMLKPLQLISWSIGKVLFPVFSSIQDDMERTRAVYLKIVRSISLITFPMMTGLIMVSGEFILTVYGERWRPAILPLKLLCIVGALQSIGTTGGVIFNSQGRPDITLKIGIVSSIAIIIAFVIGIQWGLLGLITAYIAVSFPVFLLGQYFANRLIGLKTADFARSLAPAAFCSAMMVSVLLVFRLLNTNSLHFDIRTTLIAFVALGAASYIIFAAKVLKIPEVSDALDIVKRKF